MLVLKKPPEPRLPFELSDIRLTEIDELTGLEKQEKIFIRERRNQLQGLYVLPEFIFTAICTDMVNMEEERPNQVMVYN